MWMLMATCTSVASEFFLLIPKHTMNNLKIVPTATAQRVAYSMSLTLSPKHASSASCLSPAHGCHVWYMNHCMHVIAAVLRLTEHEMCCNEDGKLALHCQLHPCSATKRFAATNQRQAIMYLAPLRCSTVTVYFTGGMTHTSA